MIMDSKHHRPSRREVATGAGALAATAAVAGSAAARERVVVTRPGPGKPLLDIGAYDLAPLGFVVEEFFISGTAQAYKASAPLGTDGVWTPATTGAGAAFTTRIVVVRPARAAKFNGSVLVEWLNVSGGRDGGPVWTMIHREVLRAGGAYVGVSAQKVGVDGGASLMPSALPLKKADPGRYGGLAHPGDAYAYDIFSDAGRAVRGQGTAKVLGPLTAKRVLAAGESQSAAYMTTYANAFDRLAKVYDGILIHSRSGGATPLGGGFFGQQGAVPIGIRIRADVRVPVMTMLTETDVLGISLPGLRGPTGYWTARQPDSERVRTWEVPGTAHADTYLVGGGMLDSGPDSLPAVAAAVRPRLEIMGMALDKLPNSSLAHHFVMASAYASLDRWVRTGQAPAKGAPIETLAPAAAGANVTPVVDEHGNAKGGVRTPWLDVPTARLAGTGNSGAAFGFLIGVTEPFDPAKLAQLYPGGRADYLTRFDRALAAAVEAGFILAADQADIRALAAELYPA